MSKFNSITYAPSVVSKKVSLYVLFQRKISNIWRNKSDEIRYDIDTNSHFWSRGKSNLSKEASVPIGANPYEAMTVSNFDSEVKASSAHMLLLLE